MLVYEKQLESDIRCRIVEALGMLEDPSTVTHLLNLLLEPHPTRLRISAALALSKIGNRSIVPTLLKLLETGHGETTFLESIVQVIGAIGEKDDAEHLLPLLSHQSIDLHVRRALIQAVATLGGHSTSLTLVQLVTTHQVPPVLGLAIIDALAQIGNRAIVPALTHMLNHVQNTIEMDIHIKCALMRLNQSQNAPELVRFCQEMTDEQKVTSTIQKYEHVLLHIVETFSQLGEPSIVPCLFRPISHRHIPRVMRLKLIHAIGQLANDAATIHDLVVELAQSDMADVIHHALWAISRRMSVVIPAGEMSSAAKMPSTGKRR